MRLIASLIVSALAAAGAWAVGPVLTDGVVSVPVPSGWVVWSEDQVHLANPTPGEGWIIEGQCSASALGHPGLNPLLTLSRVDLNTARLPRHSATRLAEALLSRMRRQIPGFRPDTARTAPVVVAGLSAAACSCEATLEIGAEALSIAVTQIAVVADGDAHVVTAVLPADDDALVRMIADLPARMTLEGRPALRPMPIEIPPPIREGARQTWKVGDMVLPLPEGWRRLSITALAVRMPAASAGQPGEAAPAESGGIVRHPDDWPGLNPTVMVSHVRWPPHRLTFDPTDLCRTLGASLLRTQVEGMWVSGPDRIGGVSTTGALGVIDGALGVGEERVAVRVFLAVLIADGGVIQAVALTETGDLESQRSVEEVFASLVP